VSAKSLFSGKRAYGLIADTTAATAAFADVSRKLCYYHYIVVIVLHLLETCRHITNGIIAFMVQQHQRKTCDLRTG
jgi:hypothetical protein